MKIGYADFVKTMLDKLERDGGKSQTKMLKGKVMNLWLAKTGDGIKNDHFYLNCEFKILYAIYEKALSFGGKMYLGSSAAHSGRRIGCEEFPVDTIDGFISLEFYGKKIGGTTRRRSTYYAAILAWAGFVTNNWGGYITVKKAYMDKD